MAGLTNISSLIASTGGTNLTPLMQDNNPAGGFDSLLNELITRSLPTPQGKEKAIQTQQALEDYEKKLALLNGMAQQAQIVMNSTQALPGGFSTPQAQDYFYAKSLLGQLGLPGAVLEVV